MTNDLAPRPKVDVLSPERSGPEPQSRRPMVVSAINRIRHQVIQKEMAAYHAKVRTWNEIVAALRDGERLRQEYAAALVRSQNLDSLRAGEELKVLTEIRQIIADAENQKRDQENRLKEQTLRGVRLDAEIIKAQRDLDALKRPESHEEISRGKRRVAEIRRIREERDEMIAVICDGKPEAELPEEDQHTISDIRLGADHEIKSFLEGGRD